MSARPDGFHLSFTQELAPGTGEDPAAWSVESYTYMLHSDYGSPEVDRATVAVTGVERDPDGRGLTVHMDGLRAGYVHELRPRGIQSASGTDLANARAYYTLVRIPKD